MNVQLIQDAVPAVEPSKAIFLYFTFQLKR